MNPDDKPVIWLGSKIQSPPMINEARLQAGFLVRMTRRSTSEQVDEMGSKTGKRLQDKGWVVGDAADFFELTPEEARIIDLKLALRANLREERRRQGLTQAELARSMRTSQSRVARMERGDPSVSVDLLLKALMTLGMTNKQISRLIA
jgi:predicted XRE-type DNA-binding protein